MDNWTFILRTTELPDPSYLMFNLFFAPPPELNFPEGSALYFEIHTIVGLLWRTFARSLSAADATKIPTNKLKFLADIPTI